MIKENEVSRGGIQHTYVALKWLEQVHLAQRALERSQNGEQRLFGKKQILCDFSHSNYLNIGTFANRKKQISIYIGTKHKHSKYGVIK